MTADRIDRMAVWGFYVVAFVPSLVVMMTWDPPPECPLCRPYVTTYLHVGWFDRQPAQPISFDLNGHRPLQKSDGDDHPVVVFHGDNRPRQAAQRTFGDLDLTARTKVRTSGSSSTIRISAGPSAVVLIM